MNDLVHFQRTIEEMPVHQVVAHAHLAHTLIMPERAIRREKKDKLSNDKEKIL